MLIRSEHPDDHAAISDITVRAFADAEHSDHTEQDIIARLRRDGALTVSLVAVDDGVLVGHVAFSPVTIDGVKGDWFGLGPVSVDPDRQRGGIGSALIREGLDRLRSQGASGCVVLGDPGYYPRFGFERDGRLRYEGAPPEYFMCMAFDGHALPAGRVDYAPAFSGEGA